MKILNRNNKLKEITKKYIDKKSIWHVQLSMYTSSVSIATS